MYLWGNIGGEGMKWNAMVIFKTERSMFKKNLLILRKEHNKLEGNKAVEIWVVRLLADILMVCMFTLLYLIGLMLKHRAHMYRMPSLASCVWLQVFYSSVERFLSNECVFVAQVVQVATEYRVAW